MPWCEPTSSARQRAAATARAVLAGTAHWRDWVSEFGDSSDADIAELDDLLTHLPRRPRWKWLFDSRGLYDAAVEDIEEVVRRLEA